MALCLTGFKFDLTDWNKYSLKLTITIQTPELLSKKVITCRT